MSTLHPCHHERFQLAARERNSSWLSCSCREYSFRGGARSVGYSSLCPMRTNMPAQFQPITDALLFRECCCRPTKIAVQFFWAQTHRNHEYASVQVRLIGPFRTRPAKSGARTATASLWLPARGSPTGASESAPRCARGSQPPIVDVLFFLFRKGLSTFFLRAALSFFFLVETCPSVYELADGRRTLPLVYLQRTRR
jgi:hypothetical protein